MIEQGGGKEYGKEFRNFCVAYFICLIAICVCKKLKH